MFNLYNPQFKNLKLLVFIAQLSILKKLDTLKT
jgi:hypothetical protein